MTERQKFILDQIPTGELVEYLSDERKVDLNIVDPKKSQYELVTDFLNENGFKINLLGYEYARSIILFALAQEEREQITTMYMIVAEEHNVNWKRVERAIRCSIEKSNLEKVTNGQFIWKTVEIIREKLA